MIRLLACCIALVYPACSVIYDPQSGLIYSELELPVSAAK